MNYAIGVDIGGTKIHFALVDKAGRIIRHEIVPTLAGLGPEHVMQSVLGGIDKLIRQGEEQIAGIGIGSAGQIDFATGTVSFAVDTLPGWTGTPIKQTVEQRFGLTVYVDNDVNVIAIAEKCFGAGRQYEHYVCLALGTGVGGAVVADGRLIRGTSGGAGELGHSSVQFDGPRCSCGNYGCIEMYASGTGIARVALEALGDDDASNTRGLSAIEVLADWTVGAPYAVRAMGVVIRALASAISGIIHTFNPQAIIIAGGVAEAGSAFFAALEKEAAARTSPGMWKDCRIVPSYTGAGAGVIGAAAQVWHYAEERSGKQVSL
ncbi:ROK family protein [Candidatus Pristimantibacillus sp. PTI5]|uniref:ROK family protein n=1 Tax=Candidatus Pristimantibacillus sp. PTI5 TaxID=3400422 RepID=UPI003B0224BF